MPPLAKIKLGDTDARDKTNTAFEKIDAVDSALSAEVQARGDGDVVRALYSEVGPMRQRPGEPGRFFTATLDGAPSVVVPIADGMKVLTADGLVARLPGGGRIGPISVFRVEPGHQYRARFVFRRAEDSEDPANDAVRLGLHWLKNDKGGLGETVLADLLDLRVENGRLEFSFNFATIAAGNINAVAPAGAVYVRPFIRTFSFGVTDVEVIEVTDLTLAADYSPDLMLYRNEIAGLRQQLDDALARIETLEGA